MSPWVIRYFHAVKEWDKSHRLIGATDFEVLFQESREAVFNSVPRETHGLVDIGAGSGVLGCAFLDVRPDSFVVFIEEDLKKASFLIYLFSSLIPELSGRVKVIASSYQNVSRETVDLFANGRSYWMSARAFSGTYTLKDAHKSSPFKDLPIYSFEMKENAEKKRFFELLPLEK